MPSRKFHLLQVALDKVELETHLQRKLIGFYFGNLWVSISWCIFLFLLGADLMELGTDTNPKHLGTGYWEDYAS